MALTRRDEARCHELREQSGTTWNRLARDRRGCQSPTTLLNEDVVASSAVEHIEPGSADQDVIAGSTGQGVIAGTADEDVIAVAAIGGELDGARREPRRLDDVIARKSIDNDTVVGGLEAGDVYRGGKTQDGDPAGVTDDDDGVVAIRGVDKDRIRRIVAGRPVERAGEIDVDLRHVRPAQVVDHDFVDAAKGIEIDVLDVVKVHVDVGDVAEEGGALAVGRDGDFLADDGAV